MQSDVFGQIFSAHSLSSVDNIKHVSARCIVLFVGERIKMLFYLYVRK